MTIDLKCINSLFVHQCQWRENVTTQTRDSHTGQDYLKVEIEPAGYS